jgi:hypothetical protein
MRRIRSTMFFLFLLATANLFSLEERTDTANVKLPVHRVVLYKNGVGYFEHTGKVHGNQQVNIDFTTAQLNDVLKSMTVVDLSGGHISGVNYNSVAPLDERLRTLRLPLGAATTREEFLNALRGTRVEIKSNGTPVEGRLLSVETHPRLRDNKEEEKIFDVTLYTDAGEMRTFSLDPLTSVRVVDQDLNQEVGRYMELIASTHAKDLRRMTVSASGTGERNLFVSYISEVPVWKSTYRILLPETASGKTHLQGWAIVDNTVGEDWNNVELSLVAGAPQSFVQNLSQPLYIRRPVVELPRTAQLTPQMHEGAMIKDEIANSFKINANEVNGPARDKKQFQYANQSAIDVTAASPIVNTEAIGGMSTGAFQISAGNEPVAQAQEMGDLYEYRLKEPVSINKNQSALVPILSSVIETEKVTLWHEGARYALRSLWVRNTSGQTLDSGAFNVVDGGAFAGEGIMDILKPRERRLLSYAVEQGVRFKTDLSVDHDKVRHVYVRDGYIYGVRLVREHKSYIVENNDESSHAIVIEHPKRSNYALDKTSTPEETTTSQYRFKFEAAPTKTTKFIVNESYETTNSYGISTLSDDSLRYDVKTEQLPETLEKLLRPIMQQKHLIEELNEKSKNKSNDLANIERDQQRVRENMKALKGSAEEKVLTARYAKQFNEQEDMIEVLRKEILALTKQVAAENTKLNSMIKEFKYDDAIKAEQDKY